MSERNFGPHKISYRIGGEEFPVDKLRKGLPLSIIKINAKLQVIYLEWCGFDIQKGLF
jgi:hypothetical protein